MHNYAPLEHTVIPRLYFCSIPVVLSLQWCHLSSGITNWLIHGYTHV